MSGASAMTSSSGTLMTNYARIGHAAQQVFPDILQDIIAIKEPQHRLYGDVTSNRFLNRNLRADEWTMINNVSANGYVNFDIPLIYKLVRNLNLVPPPSKGWDFHIPPAATEILPGDDIERIRRTRNEILHRGNAQVSDTILTDYFTSFKDIATRLEAYLGKPKGEFVQKFQNLENCCMDEDTEKTYLERLTILRERDINLSKAVENIQKNLDSLIYKDSHQLEIEEWEEQNKLFIKTDAVDFVLESLTDNNRCTVIGTSGIGKSATIHHVALFLRDTEGYRIIPIHSPSDIVKYFQRNWKQIFVIDDVCGKYTVIQTEVEKWIKRRDSTMRVLNQKDVKLIASCRIQVFNENQFQRLKLFTANFCNLSSDTFYLSSKVKLQIARQYLPELTVEQIKKDLDKYEFLPLMFALYKSFYRENEHIDALKFFKNPFDIYTEEIDQLMELFDKTKFCALFFLVIYNGCLDVAVLKNSESDQEQQTREDFFEDCGIPRNTLRQRIMEQLESLVPLFVRGKYDLSRQVISFSGIHDKTFDFLCFYYCNKFQKSFLRFADIKMLYERTMLISLVSPDEKVEEFTLLIKDFNEDEYFKRIMDQWSRGKLTSLFYSRQMNSEKYRNKLMDYLNKLPEERRKELITIKIDNGDSIVKFNHIEDGCSGSFPVSPLSLASKRKLSDFLNYILHFINDTKGEAFSILLMKACSAGLTDVARIFIHKGSDVHSRDTNGWTPLMAACEHGHTNIVELLLKSEDCLNRIITEKEVDVNVSSKNGETPLILSCKNGKSDIIRLLLDKGANVNAFNMYGHTPLRLSCENNNSDIVRLLIGKGAEVNPVKVTDMYGQTPLIVSCGNDNSNIVRLLVEEGADINVSDERELTPLIWSCVNGNSDIVQLLIEKGADVNVSDMHGQTALTWSCQNDNIDIVRLLIENGAQVNVPDTDGDSPLTLACENENFAIVQLLIEIGAELNVPCHNGDTPLMLACKNNNFKIAQSLIEHNLIVNAADDYGNGPLVNVDLQNRIGQTALILACLSGYTNIVVLIISRNPNLNVRDFDGMTALSHACKNGFDKIVKELILNGADVFLADKNGKTPLMYANENKDRKIDNCLRKHLYKSQIFDRKRKTSINQTCVDIIYQRAAKIMKVESDIH